jgi:DNA-binding NtrC family response regulator
MQETNKIQILAVDDVAANLNVLRLPLEKAGYHFLASPNGEVALKVARHSHPDLILLDVVMPDMDGYEVCRRLKADAALAAIPVIFLTARDETAGIVEGFAAGGVDYIVKPFEQEEVLARVATHLKISRLTRDLQQRTDELEREMAERARLADRVLSMEEREAQRWGLGGFVGESAAIQEILKSVAMVQGADSTRVLITGESGTGKELIARAIHSGSSRAAAAFVTVNCAAMPAELADSMFFGHRKGAFTGAERDHRGYFEQAHQGTLFLDEIGNMPPLIQAKILRVLEDGQVQPLGADQSRSVEVRVLAATNADLPRAVDEGYFRSDLYYRLAQFVVEVPPLRERVEDIAPLAEHFLQVLAREMGVESPGLAEECRALLEAHAFPGNVRELKNVIERALIESGGREIKRSHLRFIDASSAEAPPPGGVDIPDDLEEATLFWAKRALSQCDGNMSAAAELLGIHRSRLYRILAREHPL